MDRSVLAQECVEIERAGGSVRDYLRERGFISPWGTWYRLQKEELHRKEHEITYGRENTMATRVSLEQKKKAVQIALDGGNPFDFLSDCGSKEPAGLWWTIKQNLKKVDPETYAKLPAMLPKKEPVKKAGKKPNIIPPEEREAHNEERLKEAEKRGIGQEEKRNILPGLPEEKKAVIEQMVNEPETAMDITEKIKNAPVARAVPVEFSITGLKTGIGSFTRSGKTVIWYPEVAQAVQLPVEKWNELVRVLPQVIGAMNL